MIVIFAVVRDIKNLKTPSLLSRLNRYFWAKHSNLYVRCDGNAFSKRVDVKNMYVDKRELTSSIDDVTGALVEYVKKIRNRTYDLPGCCVDY